VKLGIYSIKRVLVSENMNVVMKDNRYINKLSKIKVLVQKYYPDLYKKYTLRSVLKPNIEIRRIINWPMLLHELDEIGALEGDTILKHN